MNERQWLAATDPDNLLLFLHQQQTNLQGRMLRWVGGRRRSIYTERHLRLFTCACCRVVQRINDQPHLRQLVETSEAYGDGVASRDQLQEAFQLACAIHEREIEGRMTDPGALLDGPPSQAAQSAGMVLESRSRRWSRAALVCALVGARKAVLASMVQKQSVRDTIAHQANLVRHIFGNPFQPPPTLTNVPTVVRNLAEAVHQQNQATIGPLHDALLEAGLSELADHFADPNEWHPKGCWAIDLLTGRSQ